MLCVFTKRQIIAYVFFLCVAEILFVLTVLLIAGVILLWSLKWINICFCLFLVLCLCTFLYRLFGCLLFIRSPGNASAEQVHSNKHHTIV